MVDHNSNPRDRRWAIVVDHDPRVVSYLARGLMFFEPSHRVASATDLPRMRNWLEVQDYEISVLGCLGSRERDWEAASALSATGAVVSLECAHRKSDLMRPPRLSALLEEVRSCTGRADIHIDLTVSEVSA